MKCVYCDNEIEDDAEFCIHCGAKVSNTKGWLKNNPPNTSQYSDIQKPAENTSFSDGISYPKSPNNKNNADKSSQPKSKKKKRVWAWFVALFILGFGAYLRDGGNQVEETSVNEITGPTEVHNDQSISIETTQNLTSISQSEEPVMEAEETPVAEDAVDEEVVELTDYYRGLIDGKYPITVDLYIDLEKAKGSYYYDKYGPDNRLTLEGEWVENDEGGSNLLIKEYNAAGKLIGTFEVEGHSADMDYLEGTYTLLSKDKKMPFVLNLQQ